MIHNHPSYDATGGSSEVMAVKMRIGRREREVRALSAKIGRTRTDSETAQLAEAWADLESAKRKLTSLVRR